MLALPHEADDDNYLDNADYKVDQVIWDIPDFGAWSHHAAIRVTIKRGDHAGKVFFLDNGAVTGQHKDRGGVLMFERGALILPHETPKDKEGNLIPISTYAPLERPLL